MLPSALVVTLASAFCQSCAPTNWRSAAALGGLMAAHSLDWRFFLVLQGSATSPVISARPLAPKS